MTISRIDEPSPPGVSISITTAARLLALRALHLVLEVLLRDGVDVVVELDHDDARRVRGRRGNREEERGDDRREKGAERTPEGRVHDVFDCTSAPREPRRVVRIS